MEAEISSEPLASTRLYGVVSPKNTNHKLMTYTKQHKQKVWKLYGFELVLKPEYVSELVL